MSSRSSHKECDGSPSYDFGARPVDLLRALTSNLVAVLSRLPSRDKAEVRLQAELVNLQMTAEAVAMRDSRPSNPDMPRFDSIPSIGETLREEKRELEADRQVQTLEALLKLCDATFNGMVRAHDEAPHDGRTLSRIAWEVMWAHCGEEREKSLQKANEDLEQKSDAIQRQNHQLLKSNRRYCKAATFLGIELEKQLSWVDLRTGQLQESYDKYCEIMQENGIEPTKLDLMPEELLRAKVAHAEAWEARETSASMASELYREVRDLHLEL